MDEREKDLTKFAEAMTAVLNDIKPDFNIMAEYFVAGVIGAVEAQNQHDPDKAVEIARRALMDLDELYHYLPEDEYTDNRETSH